MDNYSRRVAIVTVLLAISFFTIARTSGEEPLVAMGAAIAALVGGGIVFVAHFLSTRHRA